MPAIARITPDVHSEIAELAYVLLADPITWLDGTDYLTDGQHRMCALRAAKIDQVAVCAR